MTSYKDSRPVELNENGIVNCEGCADYDDCPHRDAQRRNTRKHGGLELCHRIGIKADTKVDANGRQCKRTQVEDLDVYVDSSGCVSFVIDGNRDWCLPYRLGRDGFWYSCKPPIDEFRKGYAECRMGVSPI